MRRSLVSLLRDGLPQRALSTALQAMAPTPLARSFATKQSGLSGVTVTKGSAAVQQAAQQQRWVVGDADSFKKCDPCEQGGKPLDRSSALALLQQTPDWTLSEDGASISRSWQAKVIRLLDCSRARILARFFSPAPEGFQERFRLPAARGRAGGERGTSPGSSPRVVQQCDGATLDVCAWRAVLQRLHYGAQNRLLSAKFAAVRRSFHPTHNDKE